jgi:hypothetical protein
METFAKKPGKSILASSVNRAEAKATYNLLGNEKLDSKEIIRAHREATIGRMEGHPVILAVQDTTSVNDNSQQKMEGLGYISDKTKGVNIHSCLAVTPDGLVLGVLDQMGYNRAEAENTSLTREEQRNRPITEKESNRWLETMENANRGIPETVKIIHVCDRDGDMYELYNKANKNNNYFLICIRKNRITVENQKILDEIRLKPVEGRHKAHVRRDRGRNVDGRDIALGRR